MPHPLHLASIIAALPAFLLAGLLGGEEGSPFPAEDFADRWVAATASGDASGIARLLTGNAGAVFESDGKSREVKGSDYGELLAQAVRGLKSLQRERGPVEVEDSERGLRITFTVTERIHTTEGFALEAVSREEFHLPAGGGEGRAMRYRSRTLSQETLGRPESWRSYGGPSGLNGLLIDAHFRAPPKGMALLVVAALGAIALLLKTLHSLGIRRRF